MQARLRAARTVTIARYAVIVAPLASRHEGLIVSLAGVMVLVCWLAAGLSRRRRPGLWVFATTVVNIQVVIAIALLLTGALGRP